MTMPDSPPQSATSPITRLFFFVLGLIALGIGTLITLGAALIGALSVGGAAWVVRRRGAHLTRRGAWFASVGGTIAVLSVVIGVVILSDESSRKPMSAAQRAESRARAEESMPAWMRAIRPATGQAAAADSVAKRLLQNKAVVVWAGLMGAVLTSALVGTIAGSFAWGGVMLLYRGFRGHWMAGSTPEMIPGG